MQENEQIGAGEFKTHCLKLIDRVNQTKKPITITKHGKPMAKLTLIEKYSDRHNLCLHKSSLDCSTWNDI